MGLAEPFENLPQYAQRCYLPEKVDLTDEAAISEFYRELLAREIDSAEGLERLALDRSELEAALDQTGSILYINMTRQTDKEEFARAYTRFIETVPQAVKPLSHRLDIRLLELFQNYPLDEKRYFVYQRALQADVDVFCEKNVPLETQEQLLCQEYQKICGQMSVDFDGQERTLPEMGKLLLEPDRDLRERAWRAMSQRRLEDADQLEDLFERMLAVRNRIADQSGCENFRDYQFKVFHRFDYTPGDCQQFHQTVLDTVTPLWRKILSRRRQTMKVDALRPWDLSADPLGRPPLRPFEKSQQLIDKTAEIFRRLDKDLGRYYDDMAGLDLLDLASRKGKAPGGYQNTLAEARKPFIFMNAVGTDQDVRTLLHESGHAFHALACAQDPLFVYRHAPMEFCEVASMAMELLAEPCLDLFYDPSSLARSRESHLEGIVHIFVWVALVDAFQHWIYENPGHTPAERRQTWIRLSGDFLGEDVNWQGLEESQKVAWHRQLHIFEVPFYYMEYAIAQLGALQLYVYAQKDPARALAQYKSALRLGGSQPLPQLFAAAGLNFDFSARTVAPLLAVVENKLG